MWQAMRMLMLRCVLFCIFLRRRRRRKAHFRFLLLSFYFISSLVLLRILPATGCSRSCHDDHGYARILAGHWNCRWECGHDRPYGMYYYIEYLTWTLEQSSSFDITRGSSHLSFMFIFHSVSFYFLLYLHLFKLLFCACLFSHSYLVNPNKLIVYIHLLLCCSRRASWWAVRNTDPVIRTRMKASPRFRSYPGAVAL